MGESDGEEFVVADDRVEDLVSERSGEDEMTAELRVLLTVSDEVPTRSTDVG